MSTLDRAFIRAYAKDGESTASVDTYGDLPSSAASVRERSRSGERAVDQLYSEGLWYRIEQPSAAAVPAPHVATDTIRPTQEFGDASLRQPAQSMWALEPREQAVETPTEASNAPTAEQIQPATASPPLPLAPPVDDAPEPPFSAPRPNEQNLDLAALLGQIVLGPMFDTPAAAPPLAASAREGSTLEATASSFIYSTAEDAAPAAASVDGDTETAPVAAPRLDNSTGDTIPKPHFQLCLNARRRAHCRSRGRFAGYCAALRKRAAGRLGGRRLGLAACLRAVVAPRRPAFCRRRRKGDRLRKGRKKRCGGNQPPARSRAHDAGHVPGAARCGGFAGCGTGRRRL